jgi:hypothetical protein
MSIRHREPAPIELVRPSFYFFLICYYCGLATFGSTLMVFSSKSLADVGGDHFAFLWACALTAFCIVAVGGVVITRRFDLGVVEVFTSIAVTAMFIGYSTALLQRGFTVPEAASSIPLAVLPIVLSLLPVYRVWVMVLDGTAIRGLSVKFHNWKDAHYPASAPATKHYR